MGKAIRALMLSLLLVCSAQAGYIPNDSPTPPPPQPASSVEEEPAAEGDMQNGLADTLTEAALSVLNNVLGLL